MLASSLAIFPFIHFHPLFLLVSLFLYFLPAFLARNKANFTPILILNLLAGWTFIGWIVALVWALSSEGQQLGQATEVVHPLVASYIKEAAISL